MSTHKAKFITDALPILARDLLDNGVEQTHSSGKRTQIVRRLKKPLLLEITNPSHRNILLKEREWNPIRAYAEALWTILGWNSLDDLTGRYVQSLTDTSDDGETWRGACGPRIRYYTPGTEQYNIGETTIIPGFSVDQLKYVYEELKSNPTSRQATITISDPVKDLYTPNGKRLNTKNYPCTRELIFEKDPEAQGLNITVIMRSNDLHDGFSSVNFFVYSLIQETLARMLGWEIGKYYHFAINFHYYLKSELMLRKLASYDPERLIMAEPNRAKYIPGKGFDEVRLQNVLKYVRDVENYSYQKDFNNAVKAQTMLDRMDISTYGFFADWARVFLRFNVKNDPIHTDIKINKLIKFKEPYMEATLGMED